MIAVADRLERLPVSVLCKRGRGGLAFNCDQLAAHGAGGSP